MGYRFAQQIQYSDKYYDDNYEYRHVILTEAAFKLMPKDRLLKEHEWRKIGVQQSQGWEHYLLFPPEPFVLLFRRSLIQTPLDMMAQQLNEDESDY